MSPGGDEGELLRNMDEVSPGHWSGHGGSRAEPECRRSSVSVKMELVIRTAAGRDCQPTH